MTAKFEVNAKCLAREVIKRFDETQGIGQDLQCHFTGKESRLFCHNFMHLIKWLSNEKDDQRQEQTVLTYAYVGLKLRDYMSSVPMLSNGRIVVSDEYNHRIQTFE